MQAQRASGEVFDALGKMPRLRREPQQNRRSPPRSGPRRAPVTGPPWSASAGLCRNRASGSDIGIGVDGTSCTVVFLDAAGEPLRDAIMWMDIRAVKEAADAAATGDPALRYVGGENASAVRFPCKHRRRNGSRGLREGGNRLRADRGWPPPAVNDREYRYNDNQAVYNINEAVSLYRL